NALFRSGQFGGNSVLGAAAQKAHSLIIDSYLSNRGPTNWITYTDIGEWGTSDYLGRAAINEFIQFANNHDAAVYWHAFRDGQGLLLDGSARNAPHGYVMTFAAQAPGEQPATQRFWSVTAYTPQAVELIANPAQKYAVAAYTPNLTPNDDGSVSIWM